MDPKAVESEARSAIAGASTLADLDEARVRYLGRKSELKQALREVRDAETGSVLNTLREGLEDAVAERQAELERADLDRRLTDEVMDITLPGERKQRGHLHLITQIRREVEDIFLGLGYQVVDGREVETTHYNFDALNFPADHPTRSPRQSVFLNGDVLFRTETSPSQIRVMESQPPPIYMVSLGRVYRRDTPDATHTPIFHQIEGLAIDRGITMADLKGTLLHMMRALFGDEREMRFRTQLLPLHGAVASSPTSAASSATAPAARSAGTRAGSRSLGSGMVEPERASSSSVSTPRSGRASPSEWGSSASPCSATAFPHLGLLWENDLRVLRQFR